MECRKAYDKACSSHREHLDTIRKEWLEALTKNICAQMSTPYEGVIGKDRYQDFVMPRFVTYYIAGTYLTDAMSVTFIGAFFKGKHCNVIYGRSKLKNKMSRNPQFRQKISDIVNVLRKADFL